MDIRKAFHQQLEDITRDLVRMAAIVTESLPHVTEALLDGDLAEAQRLIDGDDLLDALTLEVEERCYRVLALQNPMASDLRSIITAIRMASEIERSGDLVSNIAKAARRIYGAELRPRLRGLIGQMGDEATRLLRLAIDSYADHDAALAAALDDLDDRLDTVHHEFIEALFEERGDESLPLQVAVQMALIGRYYERIGDHAVNIGERVRYMVTGWLPEHTGAAREEAKRRGALPGLDRATAPGADPLPEESEQPPPPGRSAAPPT
ncbi:MAG: phosphate signaling complex protein PhoU [Actinobacteria bacterium]|nr:phosphate signaling complex protein PhoU [Actinomycetota bacterium]